MGSHEAHRFEGRIIAATNRDISEIEANSASCFRSDFFYRLCSDIIIVPPLRERIVEDPHELEDLVANTIEKIVGEPSPKLTDMIMDTIYKEPGRDYSWPGNVRELSQCVRRILLKQTYSKRNAGKVTNMLGKSRTGGTRSDFVSTIPGFPINNCKEFPTAQEILQFYCKFLYDKHGTLGEVSRVTRLDRRTVKKYIYSS
ncbi:MAG: sigma 54-interacting transcriptional regulator [Thermodesulfobacteriota bacterium]